MTEGTWRQSEVFEKDPNLERRQEQQEQQPNCWSVGNEPTEEQWVVENLQKIRLKNNIKKD